MLGEAVYEHFRNRCEIKATDIDLNAPWLERADVRDFRDMASSIEDFSPDLLINLAALTDLEYCERNENDSWLTNALGAENLGLIASTHGVPYVYISTAGIFDGKQEEYTDFDAPNPLSHYAKSKYYGERWVQQQVDKHWVLRAGWMMGGGPRKDKKFINKLFRQIVEGRRTLHVVDDKLGTPTYTVDFARGIDAIVESGLFGLYNQVCTGGGSRYDVAVEFVRLLGRENTVAIEKVASDHFKTEYFAPRPPSEKLINMKLDARGINVMRDWRTCLAEYSEVFRNVLSR